MTKTKCVQSYHTLKKKLVSLRNLFKGFVDFLRNPQKGLEIVSIFETLFRFRSVHETLFRFRNLHETLFGSVWYLIFFQCSTIQSTWMLSPLHKLKDTKRETQVKKH